MRTLHLLLDLDGTLTDPKPGISRCIAHALAALGHEPPDPDSLGWCIGPPLLQSFARLLGSTDQTLLEEAVLLYRERFAEVGLYENRVYDGIPEVLAALRQQGLLLHLATAKPSIYAVRILEHFGLADLFSSINGSELDGRLTDKPALIRHILTKQELETDQTMIIGDRKYDILGGKANRIRTLGVTYGYGSRQELMEAGPDLLVDAPEQLLGHLAPPTPAPVTPLETNSSNR